MRVLSVNCGSSTLKFKLVDVGENARELAGGVVERIGGEGPSLLFRTNGVATREPVAREPVAAPDHEAAIRRVLDRLSSAGFTGRDGPDAIGHRVVHGGEHFAGPALIDEGVMSAIHRLGELAPLHNGPAVAAIRAARETAGPGVPMVAVFDTAFHRTMPERAARYAIPRELAERHRIRRYGFHGTAHRCMVRRYAGLTGRPVEDVRLVTLQLGNGCSAAAVEGGRSVDTSMGFTPLEGLVMGTRSGSVDPALIPYLARREGVDAAEVEGWLNRRSGLLGVSGTSRDVRELLEAEAGGDADAALALEMFCYGVRKQVGAYLAALDGADAVVFGGGIGENAPSIRARVCAGMGWCGLVLDGGRNDRAVGVAVGVGARISADHSGIDAYVIPVDEETAIAEDTARCLRPREGDAG
ncbi:MAG: Acetate kinase [uncultured Rubrobacteraceae bacterium]|uniref:Acetate kinase n=1 Tax=uncultured Rubrobacteraceae bacterium TaxID=349277 RepID=A0A6J4RBW6_9ACTN|nr:MAG: Acetate kinase [uncultured Rubrobacteraceae bacterium]